MARRSILLQGQELRADGSIQSATTGGPSEPSLDDNLAQMAQLDVPTLRANWASLFGRPPPKGIGRRLLELAAAYQAQEKIHGGLKIPVRRKLLQATRTKLKEGSEPLARSRSTALSEGSRLVREWHGRSHTVEVAADGFMYAGRRYRSLSEVARAITGARWSGPRFFGL
jgi:hypothetical protein